MIIPVRRPRKSVPELMKPQHGAGRSKSPAAAGRDDRSGPLRDPPSSPPAGPMTRGRVRALLSRVNTHSQMVFGSAVSPGVGSERVGATIVVSPAAHSEHLDSHVRARDNVDRPP